MTIKNTSLDRRYFPCSGRSGSLIGCRSQLGTGLIVYFCLLFTAVSIGLTSYKLVPIYVAHSSVKQILGKFAGETETAKMTPYNARKALSRRFASSRVEVIKPKDIEFERIPKGLRINGNYSQTVPFIYNIDFVVNFTDLEYEATSD